MAAAAAAAAAAAMPSGPLEEICDAFFKPFACGLGVLTLISGIVFLTSIKTLAPEEQIVIHYLNGNEVVNGPCTKILNPFRDKTFRTRLKVGELEYARVKNSMNGEWHMVEGISNDFMGPYDVSDGVLPKIVLLKDQYVRLTDKLTGEERVVKGAGSVIPSVWEETDGVEEAVDVNKDQAVVVLNKATGTKKIHKKSGLFFPDAYEVIVETQRLVRVLPHETMIVRNVYGRYEVRSGAGSDGNGTGTAFFLEPFEEIVEMQWSAFSEPEDGEDQQKTIAQVTRIDMRARRTAFQFDVRTNDNVPMRIEGTIFWKVVDVEKLINATADPPGDIFYKAQSAMIAAISQVDLETFMKTFNTLIQNAFVAQASDGFYSERGVEVENMQVTKYDCTDTETAETLQEIIEETIDRINRVTAQKSENDVKAAKLFSDITIELDRTTLIRSQALNEELLASLEGQAAGIELAISDTTFLNHLNETVPDLDERVELYNLHKKVESQNKRTKKIASYDKATLMLTPAHMQLDSMNLRLQEL